MIEYHKIQTVFKRNPETNFKTLLEGEYSLPEFEYLAKNEWVFTEKVDGTNIRVIWNAGVLSYGGKTDNASIPSPLIKNMDGMFKSQVDKFSELFSNGVCFYGEGYGTKIQKGGENYRADQSFVLFDVKVGEWWLQRKDVEDIAIKFGIGVVPVIGTGTLLDMVAIARQGFESTWGAFGAEGIVARPKTELKCRNGDRIITKIKHKDFSPQ